MRELKRNLPLGTVTFLFTDIEGSTQLVAKIGPKASGDVLDRHNRLVGVAMFRPPERRASTASDSSAACPTSPLETPTA